MSTPAKDAALLLCPCCDSVPRAEPYMAEVNDWGDKSETGVVYCRHCGLNMQTCHGQAEAEKRWNTRAIDAATAELRAEVERLRAENERYKAGLVEICQLTDCRCEDAWTGRGRHAPDCPYDANYAAHEALGLIDEDGNIIESDVK